MIRRTIRDDRAFAALVQEHDRSLRTLAFAMLGDAERVDAVLGRSYVSAYRETMDGRARQADMIWLAGVVFAKTRQDVRRFGRGQPAPPRSVLGSLATLPLDEIATVVLVDAEGLAPEAAAAVVGAPNAEMATLLDHARAAVRGVLPSTASSGSPPAAPGAAPGRLGRDVRVGSALREITVPGHGPTFWSRLGARLLEVRDGTAAGAGGLPGSAPAAGAGVGGSTGAAGSTALTAATTSGVPAVSAPAEPGPPAAPQLIRLGGQPPRRLTPPPDAPLYRSRARRYRYHEPRPISPAMAIALAAIVVVVAVVVFKETRPKHGAGPSTQAISIAGKVSAAWANASTVQAIIETTTYPGGTATSVTAAFEGQSDGSFRYTQLDGKFDVGFTAATGTRRQFSSDGKQSSGVEETGLAPGPPDAVGTGELPFEAEMETAVRAWRTSTAVTVRDTTGANPTWVIDAVLRPATGATTAAGAPDHIVVTVDQATAIISHIARTSAGTKVDDIDIHDVKLSEPLAQNAFTVPFPTGLRVTTFNDGFVRKSSVDELSTATGYAAATPSYLPAGFQLAEVAYAAAITPGSPSAQSTSTNPPSSQVGVLVYRYGFETLVVTTRAAGDDPSKWSDPFGGDSSAIAVTLSEGRFVGAHVTVVSERGAVAHLWGVDAKAALVLTIAGDVDRPTIERIANSIGT